jgi:hypothetical protein
METSQDPPYRTSGERAGHQDGRQCPATLLCSARKPGSAPVQTKAKRTNEKRLGGLASCNRVACCLSSPLLPRSDARVPPGREKKKRRWIVLVCLPHPPTVPTRSQQTNPGKSISPARAGASKLTKEKIPTPVSVSSLHQISAPPPCREIHPPISHTTAPHVIVPPQPFVRDVTDSQVQT